MNKSIILLGIKHSGKSTQGLLLSKELNCPWIDLDDKITELTGKTPREIYTQQGAAGFMQAEENACLKVVEEFKNQKIVISTGGGICDNAPALEILSQFGTFIFLKTTEEVSISRIINKAEQLSNGTWKNLPAYISNKNPKTENEISILDDITLHRLCVGYIKLCMRGSNNLKLVSPTLHKTAAYKAAGSCYQYFLHSVIGYC